MANETVLFKRGDSATITSTPVTDGQILFDTSGNGKMYLDNGTDRLEMGGAITVDASLSNTSTNAIQNKAVTGNILNSLAEVSAATQQNTIAGALALKEVNSSKVSNFTSGNYKAVTGLAYDATNKKLGLKVGADTVIPFSGGSDLSYKIVICNEFSTQYKGILSDQVIIKTSEQSLTIRPYMYACNNVKRETNISLFVNGTRVLYFKTTTNNMAQNIAPSPALSTSYSQLAPVMPITVQNGDILTFGINCNADGSASSGSGYFYGLWIIE